MSGPLQRGLEVVPGMGDATIQKLAALEIHTLDQLMGKFMSFDRDCALMLNWSRPRAAIEPLTRSAPGWRRTNYAAATPRLQFMPLR